MSVRQIVTLPDDTVLVIGAGLAGLFLALKLAPRRALVLSPSPLGERAASAWAQGGLAAALGPDDDPELHAQDTIAAGAGLVDPVVASLIAREGPARVLDLLALGVPFDTTPEGQLALSLEAAHSRPRVARVKGDLAGKAIMEALIGATRAATHIDVREGLAMNALLHDGHGRCGGALCLDADGNEVELRACETVLAVGGVGGLYRVTTNPVSAQGVALAAASRIGAVISDPEFVQFHPTAIDIARDPAPLATEALRGDGAFLVDRDGRRFMGDYDAAGDLAPRDIVARAIHSEITAGRGAFLDARAAVGDHFPDMLCRTDLLKVGAARKVEGAGRHRPLRRAQQHETIDCPSRRQHSIDRYPRISRRACHAVDAVHQHLHARTCRSRLHIQNPAGQPHRSDVLRHLRGRDSAGARVHGERAQGKRRGACGKSRRDHPHPSAPGDPPG